MSVPGPTLLGLTIRTRVVKQHMSVPGPTLLGLTIRTRVVKQQISVPGPTLVGLTIRTRVVKQQMSVPGPWKIHCRLSRGLNGMMPSIWSVSLFNGIAHFTIDHKLAPPIPVLPMGDIGEKRWCTLITTQQAGFYPKSLLGFAIHDVGYVHQCKTTTLIPSVWPGKFPEQFANKMWHSTWN